MDHLGLCLRFDLYIYIFTRKEEKKKKRVKAEMVDGSTFSFWIAAFCFGFCELNILTMKSTFGVVS